MRAAPITGWLVLCLAPGIVAGAAAYGQQKYKLRHTAAAGDVCTVDSNTDLSLMLTVSAPGSDQGEQQLPFSERRRQSYREKVMAVDQKGPTVVRRTYTIARSVTTDPYLHETTKVSSLQGKTVTLRRVGNQVTVAAERGKLAAEDEKSLARELSHSEMEFFPDRDVAPGEEWPIDPHLLLAMFPGVDKADAQYRFQQVVPFAGHPCAQIHVTVEVQGEAPGTGVPMTIKLAGELYRALDLKRTVAEDESGPITVSGTKAENGVTARISGQGTLRVRETHRWVTIDGRPVTGGA